jgi:hypothetical protein
VAERAPVDADSAARHLGELSLEVVPSLDCIIKICRGEAIPENLYTTVDLKSEEPDNSSLVDETTPTTDGVAAMLISSDTSDSESDSLASCHSEEPTVTTTAVVVASHSERSPPPIGDCAEPLSLLCRGFSRTHCYYSAYNSGRGTRAGYVSNKKYRTKCFVYFWTWIATMYVIAAEIIAVEN